MKKQGLFQVAGLFLLCITSLDAGDGSAVETLDSFSYAFPGGLSLYQDSYEFCPPFTLTIFRKSNFRPGKATRTCTYQVPQCGEAGLVDVCDLEEVLSDYQVLDLWSRGEESVYGRDPRHQDGGVFTIEAQGTSQLIVGELCQDRSVECFEEHEALIRLRQIFVDLSRQANSSSECTDLGI